MLPLTFIDVNDYDRIHAGDTIRIPTVKTALHAGAEIAATVDGNDNPIHLRHNLSERQIEILMAGGAINWHDNRQTH